MMPPAHVQTADQVNPATYYYSEPVRPDFLASIGADRGSVINSVIVIDRNLVDSPGGWLRQVTPIGVHIVAAEKAVHAVAAKLNLEGAKVDHFDGPAGKRFVTVDVPSGQSAKTEYAIEGRFFRELRKIAPAIATGPVDVVLRFVDADVV